MKITIQLTGFINNIMLYNPDDSNVTCSEKNRLILKTQPRLIINLKK